MTFAQSAGAMQIKPLATHMGTTKTTTGGMSNGFDMGHMIGPIFHTPTQTKSEPSDRAQQVAVPSGYALVPIEPTQSMKEAMTKIIDLYYNPANKKQMYKAAHAYKAMLKAHAIEQAVRGKP